MPHVLVGDNLAKPSMESGLGMPLGAVRTLLADLDSQHERLRQMSSDIAGALSTVQGTAEQLHRLVSPPPQPTDGEADTPAGTSGDSCVSVILPDVVEEGKQPGALARGRPQRGLSEGVERGSKAAKEAGDTVEVSAQSQRSRSRSLLRATSTLEGVESGQHLSAAELMAESAERPRLSKQPIFSDDPDCCERSISLTMGTEGMNMVRKNAVLRLQARLGKSHLNGLITAQEVYRSVTALGLVKYSELDIKGWLSSVTLLCHEHTVCHNNASTAGKIVKKLRQSVTRKLSKDSWEEGRKKAVHVGTSLKLKSFVELLLDDEALSMLSSEFQDMSLTIREVLFSGEANRLVAELTHVCIDDVAAPLEKPDLITSMEPLVGCVIILNGFFLGLQAASEGPGLDQWFWSNVACFAFFCLEFCIRTCTYGPKEFFTGYDKSWNIFDTVLLFVSALDILMEAVSVGANVAMLNVMRILRLMRLTRLVRIFRLRHMKELTLMVRGLIGGLYTLLWAVVLLFFTIYMIACIATSVMGSSGGPPEMAGEELFSSVPRSIFTTFRCFMGDCNTSRGMPIVKLMADHYGIGFVLCYFVSMLFVTFGLFNLIMAIYIENTLNAAKTEGEKGRVQRQRESVRIARLTRQLLKKFSALQRVWGNGPHVCSEDRESQEVKMIASVAAFDDIGGVSMRVSKEMFLCLIQDASVQKLMDELDIPQERASLFDILDADGSGDLEVIELLTGLLRVRGEAKKSDIVGTQLAVHAVQEMLREMSERLTDVAYGVDKLQWGRRPAGPAARGLFAHASTSPEGSLLIEGPTRARSKWWQESKAGRSTMGF